MYYFLTVMTVLDLPDVIFWPMWPPTPNEFPTPALINTMPTEVAERMLQWSSFLQPESIFYGEIMGICPHSQFINTLLCTLEECAV